MALDLFFRPRLTELGKIKIGGKSSQVRRSANGVNWRAPEKHDYFTVTSMNRTPAGDLETDEALMTQLIGEYGSPDGKLRQIPIRLLSNEIEDLMQSAWLWYGGRTVGARSDAQTVTWFNSPEDGKRLTQPKTEEWKPELRELKDGKGHRLFKLHTVFNCVIAAREARFGGVYRFRTTSIISGEQLYGSLIESSRLTHGILVNMPFVMIVRPIQVAPEGRPTTVYVVHVELRAPDVNAIEERALKQMEFMVAHREQIQLAQASYRRLMLPPGLEQSAEERKDINEEFQPETADEETERPPADLDPLLAQPVEAGASPALGGSEPSGRPAPEQQAGEQEEPIEDVPQDSSHAADSTPPAVGRASANPPEARQETPAAAERPVPAAPAAPPSPPAPATPGPDSGTSKAGKDQGAGEAILPIDESQKGFLREAQKTLGWTLQRMNQEAKAQGLSCIAKMMEPDAAKFCLHIKGLLNPAAGASATFNRTAALAHIAGWLKGWQEEDDDSHWLAAQRAMRVLGCTAATADKLLDDGVERLLMACRQIAAGNGK